MKALRVGVVTGTRAEFGLLTPVMRAIAQHDALSLHVIGAGMHLAGDRPTIEEVASHFDVCARVPMQQGDVNGRASDARALARGVGGFVEAFEQHRIEAVVVLGDRIEAFAGASAASVMGVPVAHLHGGDVAEGVADEAMRHAITKLAHLHLPATAQSAERIAQMGEPGWRITTVGSPAADVVRATRTLDDKEFMSLGAPEMVVLHHPCDLPAAQERTIASSIALASRGHRTLWLAPNHDPGREHIETARCLSDAVLIDHLPSATYTGLLKRLANENGVLIGNSSSALIEAAICALSAIDLGPRQGGRDRCANVFHLDGDDPEALRSTIEQARLVHNNAGAHPYGDGHTGDRVAEALARADFSDPKWIRKRSRWNEPR